MKLIVYPDPILRKKTKRVVRFDASLRKLAQNMLSLMIENNGMGLAANQAGIDKSLFVCILNQKSYVIINPSILKEEGEQIGTEYCLSFPNIGKEVKRPNKILLRYQDLNGKPQNLSVEGIHARCIIHEYEHLQGILMIDH
jgi:peptide deformylase